MQKHALKGNILLLIAALCWGTTFVAQSAGMEIIGPFSYNAARCLIGGIVLLPVAWFFTRSKGWGEIKGTLIGGGVCGTILFIAMALQQVGIQYTTVNKAGFLTAMYIVLVPLLRMLTGKRPSFNLWIGIAVSVVGIYFLCVKEQMNIEKGDILMLVCAVAFASHICAVDYFGQKYDGIRLSCIQFFVSGLIAVPFMFFEQPSLAQMCDAWLPILYAGIFSSGIAYTFQILGQKDTNPVVAALIMSTESLFAAVSGWIVLGQGMTLWEIIGSLLLIFAIVFVQIPIRTKNAVK